MTNENINSLTLVTHKNLIVINIVVDSFWPPKALIYRNPTQTIYLLHNLQGQLFVESIS